MKKFLIGLFAGAGLLLATQAQAATVDFEDLHADGDLAALASTYAGLNWADDWYYGDTAVEGYDNGAHSGVSYVTNGYGVDNLSVSSATAFNFSGAWFAAPNTNGAVASWINAARRAPESPITERSARLIMSQPGSMFTATTLSQAPMPCRCWIAPEMPTAR